MKQLFSTTTPIKFEGQNSKNPMAFKYYDANKKVLGKTMKEHLRFAACYWHNFTWPGSDPFGGATFQRPWFEANDRIEAAKMRADAAFELFHILGVPYFCFHDADAIPEGATFKQGIDNLNMIAGIFEKKMEQTGVQLLWGTANLFTHRRFMAGASTNPDPEVFAYCAAQIKNMLDITHRLHGENYVMWGGREGYDSLLNTDLKQELDQLGRMLCMVVDYKHKIGFKGPILIEPKPQEPTKHQYDYDVSTIYGFLKRFGLENEVKVNIEANHATLAGHSFEHEVAMANALGIMGSFDMNRGDAQCGWDTDQFPTDVAEITMVMYHILKNGGLTTGGLNFDAKLRRQSIDNDDLIYAHIGGMDVCARGLENAARMIEDKVLSDNLADRYKNWRKGLGVDILSGKETLETLDAKMQASNLDPQPVSGKQERLENIVAQYCR